MTTVSGFYKFVEIDNPAAVAARLRRWGADLGLRGTILLAAEGINGAVSGSTAALGRWSELLRGLPGLHRLGFSLTPAGSITPFERFKVKVKREIIPLCHGEIGCDGSERLGPDDWNDLLDDPQALVIDVRNSFEHRVGRFPGSLNPGLKSFSSLAELIPRRRWGDYRRVGMYCTGGIRCEKAAPLWRAFSDCEVFQLRGGIISYLHTTEGERNRWEGECFVFDRRVALDSQLRPGNHQPCYGCGEPLTPSERADERYEYGVQCPYCHGRRSQSALSASRERVRQQQLARQRASAPQSPLRHLDHGR